MKQFVPQNWFAIVAYEEWMDRKKLGKYDLNKYGSVRDRNFPNAYELNSMARLASAERAWSSISRFYDNCKKGNPLFQKNCRSVEYKSTGWKLASDRK
jgi:putative transposase